MWCNTYIDMRYSSVLFPVLFLLCHPSRVPVRQCDQYTGAALSVALQHTTMDQLV